MDNSEIESIDSNKSKDSKDFVEIELLIDSAEWKELSPNYSRTDALLPKDLLTDDVKEIALSLFDKNRFVPVGVWSSPENLDEIKVRAGVLKPIGQGEVKQVYVLTTPDDRKMAIVLDRGYDLPAQIPSDPKIHPWNTYGDGLRYEYSDLRTYLSIPLGSRGIHFQEYGGDQHLNSLSKLTIKAAQSKVFSYIKHKGLRVLSHDFNKEAHYLLPEGRMKMPAVIDIILTDR